MLKRIHKFFVIYYKIGASNIETIIEERPADIGDFLVGRLLPFRSRRTVGPFVFFDHLGPAHLTETENLDVPPHPHIGLSTLTFLFKGEIDTDMSINALKNIKSPFEGL